MPIGTVFMPIHWNDLWAQRASPNEATTDAADQTLYLADSTENAVVIIDAKNQAFEKVFNVGLFPWGTHIMDSKDNYCH